MTEKFDEFYFLYQKNGKEHLGEFLYENLEKVIQDCIESIYKTTNAKFEIIIIDNGSVDNSHKKCKEKFKGRDPFIAVFNIMVQYKEYYLWILN